LKTILLCWKETEKFLAAGERGSEAVSPRPEDGRIMFNRCTLGSPVFEGERNRFTSIRLCRDAAYKGKGG